jgi:hypothetical protein
VIFEKLYDLIVHIYSEKCIHSYLLATWSNKDKSDKSVSCEVRVDVVVEVSICMDECIFVRKRQHRE